MNALESFERLIGARCEAPLPLLEAAASVALYARQDFDPAQVVQTVRTWGERLRARIAPDASSVSRLRMLNHFYFDELGFGPDEDDYYCVDNSYLHRVVERRAGIPITLSLLYIEIGRAIGLKLAGVGFPGHFLVKLAMSEGALFIDVFGRGQTLSADALRARLKAVLRGSDEPPLAPYLRAASEREVLARLLRNLKAIHAENEDWPALLEIQHRLVALLPDVPEERRDRAFVFERLQCPRAAAQDLSAYLAAHPEPADARHLRPRLAALWDAAKRLN
ncbi:MAG: tetratricopeptide repeat protein [Burkholderiaceae bacterium]|nr:tetratricopeptide repeat protein [Burkholderiaceae bacterium]